MVIGDDQLDPGESSGDERAEEGEPAGPVLGSGDVDAEDLPATVGQTEHMNQVTGSKVHGTDYKCYWVDEKAGKVFCLVDAPDAETAATVHREAHGLVAEEIYEVQEGA